MKAHKPSLMRILIGIQGVFLVLLLFLGIGSILRVSRQEERQAVQEQQASAAYEAVRMKQELSAYESLLWELLNRQAEEYDLLSGDTNRQYFAKNTILERCRDICQYNSKLVYVFTGCPDIYYVAHEGDISLDSIQIQKWVKSQADRGFADKRLAAWSLVRFDGKDYLLHVLTGGGHYCGCLIGADRFDARLAGKTEEMAAMILTDGAGRQTGAAIEAAQAGYPDTAEKAASAAGHPDTEAETASGAGQVIPAETGLTGSRTGTFISQPLDNGLRLLVRVNDQTPFPDRLPVTLVFLWLLCLAAFVVQTLLIYRQSARPIVRLSGQLKELGDHIQAGAELPQIDTDASTEEMYTLQTSVRHLLDEVLLSQMRDYEHQLERQDMELLMMRSQLRPHFYLNALTTIDAMTYQGREEDIRRFLQALSVHVRYMLRTDEARITLGEEMTHIEAYLDMQGIRYPNRIFHVISVADGLSDRVIPHLLIYTIVENCFKYALGVEDTLFLMIEAKPENEGSGFTVCVEDNGNGYPEEVVAQINAPQLPEMTAEEKRHIGLRNVRRTMELMYGKDGGICLENITDADTGEVRGARTLLRFPGQ